MLVVLAGLLMSAVASSPTVVQLLDGIYVADFHIAPRSVSL